MKVVGSNRSTPVASASTGQASARPRPSSSASAGKEESVSISSKSSQLQSLESSIKDAPDVDIEKIESIKKAISDGSFSISSGRVAEKMMATARELMTSQKA